MQTMQTNPIAPDTQLTVTLQAQEWNVLLSVLVKAPYENVAGLIQQITEQAHQRAQQAGGQPGLPFTNGIDQHHGGS